MTEDLFRTEPYLREAQGKVVSSGPDGIVLDRTVFYPTGGGQPGDTGHLVLADGTRIAITDTRKGTDAGRIVHLVASDANLPAVGDTVTVVLDWERRHRLMRMHTCLHLLSAVLKYPVTGGQVSDGKGRLDFAASDALPEKEAIAGAVNALIAADHPVGDRWITDEELLATPDLVKTMSVAPPMGHGRVRLIHITHDGATVDLQACGGTHVARTGEIGRIAVGKIESKGRQNRRVNIEFA